jgi:hypothetical protein
LTARLSFLRGGERGKKWPSRKAARGRRKNTPGKHGARKGSTYAVEADCRALRPATRTYSKLALHAPAAERAGGEAGVRAAL